MPELRLGRALVLLWCEPFSFAFALSLELAPSPFGCEPFSFELALSLELASSLLIWLSPTMKESICDRMRMIPFVLVIVQDIGQDAVLTALTRAGLADTRATAWSAAPKSSAPERFAVSMRALRYCVGVIERTRLRTVLCVYVSPLPHSTSYGKAKSNGNFRQYIRLPAKGGQPCIVHGRKRISDRQYGR